MREHFQHNPSTPSRLLHALSARAATGDGSAYLGFCVLVKMLGLRLRKYAHVHTISTSTVRREEKSNSADCAHTRITCTLANSGPLCCMCVCMCSGTHHVRLFHES
jgi:hypothetical protein